MTDLDIQYPLALLLLPVIPAIIYFKRNKTSKTSFAGVYLLDKSLTPGFIKRNLEDFLLSLLMIVSVFSIANIQYSSFWQETYLESKWIMIVQDLSGSMNRTGGISGEQTLGDIAINGAEDFIELRQKDDLIGLIAFSSYAKLIAPPTSDKEILKKKLALLTRGSDSIVFRELSAGGATNASYAAWLALSVFFMLLPEDSQPSFEEIDGFRYTLLGETLRKVKVPDRLRKINFGQGMAIILFTDGRIEANKSDEDVKKGLPNFANVVKLTKSLGVRLYIIAVEGDVNEEVKNAMYDAESGSDPGGRIFYMPRIMSTEKIRLIYNEINEMEKNRLLVKIIKKKKETRWALIFTGMILVISYSFMRLTPWFKKF